MQEFKYEEILKKWFAESLRLQSVHNQLLKKNLLKKFQGTYVAMYVFCVSTIT